MLPTHIDTGGPAFPLTVHTEAGRDGMTLRDYFAARAMQGLLSQHSKTLAGTMQAVFTSGEIVSREAYEIADAMIAQREIA